MKKRSTVGLSGPERRKQNLEIRISNYTRVIELLENPEGTLKCDIKIHDDVRWIKPSLPADVVLKLFNDLLAEAKKQLEDL